MKHTILVWLLTRGLFVWIWEDFLKPLFCKHDYQFVDNFCDPDDKTLLAGSWWKCSKCDKVIGKEDPFKREDGKVRKLTPAEEAYYRGYMRRMLNMPLATDYDRYPILEENQEIGFTIAGYDIEDSLKKN